MLPAALNLGKLRDTIAPALWPAELRAIGLDGPHAPVSPPAASVRRYEVPTSVGQLGITAVVPAGRINGVYLYFHGGGWVTLDADFYAPLLWPLALQTGVAVIIPDYRLAPEHPFPAAPDDCARAADWLVENSKALFGTDVRLLGGDSAGATLAVLTALRVRDAIGELPFCAIDLLYGCFDLSGTPSLRADRGQSAHFTRSHIERCIRWYANAEDLRTAAVSPLYADLHDLPPALISVGTLDPLLDDSMFMSARWQAASGNATLNLYPGGWHGFDCYPTSIAAACFAERCRFVTNAVQQSISVPATAPSVVSLDVVADRE